jgi:hypothetical protein
VSRVARLLCVSLGVALAIWLLPASIHIVDWSGDRAVRVALFAPLWKFWAALAGAIVVVTVADRRVRVWPIALLWLWAVPYLPWLPDRAPALLVFAGPLRWAVLALALGGSASSSLPRAGIVAGMQLPGRRFVFAASLAAYLAFGLWSASTVGPSADEPHYLVITQSLLRDHDLAIENNHQRGDYREYFAGELRPDFLERGVNEVIYSIHAPGLPALLAPAYALAGYRGTVVMLAIAGALAAVAVFDLALLVAGQGAALAAWAAVCLTVPFVPHTWLIFPEIPAALLMAWAALWLYAPLPRRTGTWIWRGVALAFLPWLHTKFVILLVTAIAALALRLWRTPRSVAALAMPAVVSGALWLGFFHHFYGTFDPQAPYGGFPALYVLASNIPRGVVGLLFDQKFGFLMYAPVYLVAVAGGWMMLRRPDLRPLAVALIVTVAAFVASSTRMYMWWGGSSAPARFVVPIVPLLAPLIATGFRGARPPLRAVWGLLLCVSLAIAVAGVVSPQRLLLFSAPHGLANMIEAGQGPAPLSSLLPTFTEDEMRAAVWLLGRWLVAALLAIGAVVLVARRTAAAFPTVAAGLAVFALAGAVLAGVPAAPQRRTAALRGRFELLHSWDGASLRGRDYSRNVALGEPDVLRFAAIRLSKAEGALNDDPHRLAGPFTLLPGTFTARIRFDPLPPDGAAFAVLDGRVAIARAPVNQTGETRLPFDVAVATNVSIAVSDARVAAAVTEVTLVADTIVPRSARADIDVHAIEPIDGRAGAFIAYADDAAYPEGGVYWTRSTNAATVYVSPAGASALILTLHVGRSGGAVRLLVDGQDRSVTLSPDETRQLEMPLAATARLVQVVVQAPGEFRPADRDPGSADRRWLGCQVRVGLR